LGIIDRLLRLLRANINYQLDRAEDPERLLEEIQREEHAQIARVRDRIRDMIALEKELESGLQQTRGRAVEWERKAEAAIAAGRDDLAREALRRRRDSAESARTGEQELEIQRQAVARLKERLRTLESRHEATLRRKDALVARHRRAEAQRRIAGHLDTDQTARDMTRVERKVRRIEASAAATTELADSSVDAQLMSLGDPAIEAELRALKQRLASADSDDDELDVLDQLEEGPARDGKHDALKSGL
jgi:phage shock protein A